MVVAVRHAAALAGLSHDECQPVAVAAPAADRVADRRGFAAGERDVGIDHLVDAYRTFRRLDARPLAARAAAVLEELGCRSRTEAVARAHTLGLVRSA